MAEAVGTVAGAIHFTHTALSLSQLYCDIQDVPQRIGRIRQNLDLSLKLVDLIGPDISALNTPLRTKFSEATAEITDFEKYLDSLLPSDAGSIKKSWNSFVVLTKEKGILSRSQHIERRIDLLYACVQHQMMKNR